MRRIATWRPLGVRWAIWATLAAVFATVALLIASLFVFGSLPSSPIRETQRQVGTYASGVEEYVVFMGELPRTLQHLVVPPNGAPRFVNEIRPDRWGNPIRYGVAGRTFAVCSNGPDGECGTDDDICNGIGGSSILSCPSPTPIADTGAIKELAYDVWLLTGAARSLNGYAQRAFFRWLRGGDG